MNLKARDIFKIEERNGFFDYLKEEQKKLLNEETLETLNWFVSYFPKVVDPDIRIAFIKRTNLENSKEDNKFYIPFHFLNTDEITDLQTLKMIYFDDWYMITPSWKDVQYNRFYVLFIKDKKLISKLI